MGVFPWIMTGFGGRKYPWKHTFKVLWGNYTFPTFELRNYIYESHTRKLESNFWTLREESEFIRDVYSNEIKFTIKQFRHWYWLSIIKTIALSWCYDLDFCWNLSGLILRNWNWMGFVWFLLPHSHSTTEPKFWISFCGSQFMNKNILRWELKQQNAQLFLKLSSIEIWFSWTKWNRIFWQRDTHPTFLGMAVIEDDEWAHLHIFIVFLYNISSIKDNQRAIIASENTRPHHRDDRFCEFCKLLWFSTLYRSFALKSKFQECCFTDLQVVELPLYPTSSTSCCAGREGNRNGSFV